MTFESYTEQNRNAWNEIAQARQGKMNPPEFYTDGGYNFEPYELATLGDVRGLDVLHMPCASGEDTLSLAVLGARVTGVDISDAAIDIARTKADQAGVNVRFIRSDIYALPTEIQNGSFDLVFASAGVLCWLPDITRWAEIVARTLKMGGRLILCEHHPIFDTLDVSKGRVEIGRDYFGRQTPAREEGLGKLACGVETSQHFYTFVWPLDDIVTAIITTGLRLELLKEFPYEASEYHTHLPESLRTTLRKLPVEFHLVAHKQ